MTRASRQPAPVFVVGSARSGTTLMYHMILSSGGFAVYRAETHVFDQIEPRFGDLSLRERRETLLNYYLGTEAFRRTGLDADAFRKRVHTDCRDAGDFLETVMSAIAEQQGVGRWAECTPAHLRYIPQIKKRFPDALFIHMIRDGRDVALSRAKLNWVTTLPWDRNCRTLAATVYWRWNVEIGLELAKEAAPDYLEVKFEELVSNPKGKLAEGSRFIGHEMDYDRIRQVGIGSVGQPNTAFGNSGSFQPVGRWKTGYTPEELAQVEYVIGPLLRHFHYELAGVRPPRGSRWHLSLTRLTYDVWFSAKQWAKSNTFLGRLLTKTEL